MNFWLNEINLLVLIFLHLFTTQTLGANLLQANSPQPTTLTSLGTAPASTLTNTATAIANTVAAATPGFCIFVYNLTPETEDSVLWKLFGPFGAVLSAKVCDFFCSNSYFLF